MSKLFLFSPKKFSQVFNIITLICNYTAHILHARLIKNKDLKRGSELISRYIFFCVLGMKVLRASAIFVLLTISRSVLFFLYINEEFLCLIIKKSFEMTLSFAKQHASLLSKGYRRKYR